MLSASSYGFDEPNSIAPDGTHVWVLNPGAVSELNASTGALIRVLSGESY